MKTQQQLTDQCTSEIIKKMCELAEGFNNFSKFKQSKIIYDKAVFPLLIHRAVEGWNKLNGHNRNIVISNNFIGYYDETKTTITDYILSDYQSTILTQSECAMLDCLLEVLI